MNDCILAAPTGATRSIYLCPVIPARRSEATPQSATQMRGNAAWWPSDLDPKARKRMKTNAHNAPGTKIRISQIRIRRREVQKTALGVAKTPSLTACAAALVGKHTRASYSGGSRLNCGASTPTQRRDLPESDLVRGTSICGETVIRGRKSLWVSLAAEV